MLAIITKGITNLEQRIYKRSSVAPVTSCRINKRHIESAKIFSEGVSMKKCLLVLSFALGLVGVQSAIECAPSIGLSM